MTVSKGGKEEKKASPLPLPPPPLALEAVVPLSFFWQQYWNSSNDQKGSVGRIYALKHEEMESMRNIVLPCDSEAVGGSPCRTTVTLFP